MGGLMSIYGFVAMTAWATAAWSSFEIVGSAPYAQRPSIVRYLGLWNFGEIERQLGPQVRSKLRRLKWASITFITLVATPVVLLIAILAFSAVSRKLGIA